jgi:hypothetical protein
MCRLAAAVSAVAALHANAAAQEIDTLALRAHTYYLAHDLLEGRGTGTRGEHLAAQYIISQLKRIGVSGAGPNGAYFQPVPLKEARVDDRATTLRITTGSQEREFRSGADFLLNTGGARAFRDFGGRLVYAGRPEEAAAALAGMRSLRGHVPVVLGPLGGEATALVPDWIARGAEGVILLIPNAELFELYRRSRGDTRFYVDADVGDPVWQPDLPVLLAGPELFSLISAAAASVPQSARRDGAVLLDQRAQATIRVDPAPIQAANVAALIAGRDPALRHEVVVFTAHYDHLGVGVPVNGDSIYNGFADNAAGVAMLLTAAQALVERPLAHSALFLFFTGEERGLLGSSYYASAPLVPLDRVAGVINLDAGAPPAPPVSWRVATKDRSRLAETAVRVAAERGWSAELVTASPNSDHWPFAARDVPAIFLIPGLEWEGLNATERDALRTRWDRYHQAGDEWHPEFPFAGLGRYAEYALAVARALGE